MATKKAASKKIAAKKSAPQKAVSKKASSKKTAEKKSAAKKTAASTPAKKTAAKKTAAKATAKKTAAKRSGGKGDDNYTKPELREHIKEEVMAGDKGGRPGQWSARKAQLVAHEYVAEGGGYKHERNASQKNLKEWGDEKWHTESGEKAIQGKETHRYLPDKAWKELTPAQRKATDKKKVEGSRKGKQFVANTPEANKARRDSEKHE